MSGPRSVGASVSSILIAMIASSDDPDTTAVLIGVGNASGYWGADQAAAMRQHFIGDAPAKRKRSA